MCFVGNVVFFAALKEFSISSKNWQVIAMVRVAPFLETRYFPKIVNLVKNQWYRVFSILPFPEACFFTYFPWNWLWRQHRLLTFPWDCRNGESWNSRFRITLAMVSKQPWSQPVDYAIWHVHRTQIHDVDHVIEWLVEEWSRFDHKIISAAVAQRQAHLHACVKVDRTFWTLFMTTDTWSHCFIGDNWMYSPCCHGNLYFLRVIENM